MPREIRIQPTDEIQYEVTIREGSSETRHIVTAEPDYVRRLAGDSASAADLVRRSFEFLLEREPKESILRRFHLRDISRYFPEYETTIRTR